MATVTNTDQQLAKSDPPGDEAHADHNAVEEVFAGLGSLPERPHSAPRHEETAGHSPAPKREAVFQPAPRASQRCREPEKASWTDSLLLWLCRIAMVVGIALIAMPGLFSFSGSPPRNTTAAPTAASLQTSGRVKTKAIENIRVGERVMAHNPEVSDSQRAAWQEPDFSQWLKLALEMPKPDGSTLKIELLRPAKWFIEQVRFTAAKPSQDSAKAVVNESTLIAGKPSASAALQSVVQHVGTRRRQIEAKGLQLTRLTVQMDLPELGLSDEALLLSVGPAPQITGKRDKARVVTATFHHSSGDVIDLVVDGDKGDRETFGTTSNHPFWSVDRQEYVQAGSLKSGERVLTFSGDTKRVVSKLPRPGPEPVYNLEVHAEHVYFVGHDGVLVHNAGGKVYGAKAPKRRPPVSRDANGRWHDAQGRFTSGPAAPEVLSGPKTFRRGSNTFTLEQGTAGSGWKHIWDRHVDPTRFGKKSKFGLDATESEILSYVETTIKHGKQSTFSGRTIFKKRIRMGSQTKTFRATVNADGTIQTFHPLD